MCFCFVIISVTMSEKTQKIISNVSYIFFGAVVVACLVLNIVLKLNWLTLLSCVTGIFYVAFLSDRSILNFVVGFVSSTTYIFVAFNAKLFGEVIFYLAFDLPMIFISFFMWKKNINKDLRVQSKKLNVTNSLIIILISAVAVVAYSFLLRAIGGVNVFVDATSTVVSFVATILMSLRYREQWFMWIVVYIVSIVMWATTFDLLMLIMSICCFISCLIGFVNWSVSAKKQHVVTPRFK